MQQLGTSLARLGGADAGVLEQARKEKGRYVAMGLVLLSTALLAVLSMTFAMIDGLHMSASGAVLVGLGWGFVILNLDRVLILSLRPRNGWWRLFAMIAPRILMAVLLGLVIATPLTLRIFDSEIELQMAIDNIDRAEDGIERATTGSQQAELDEIKAEIQRYEGILAGDVAYSSPNLKQAASELQQAEADKQAKEDAYWEAYDAWRCELDGDRCHDGSGERGNGPRAKSLKARVDLAEAELAEATRSANEKRQALTAAQEANQADNDEKLAEAQAEANRVLPDLRSQRDQLEQAIANQVGTVNDNSTSNTGLLARLVALEHLGDENGWARLAHLLVAGLLFMIELLPVAVKSLTILGPPTPYDQVNDLDDKRVLEDAAQMRSLTQRRRKRAEDKAIELDEDMYHRELALGKKAILRVATEMEKILQEALDKWSEEVARTLHAQSQRSQPNGSQGTLGPEDLPDSGEADPAGVGSSRPGAGGGAGQLGGRHRKLVGAIFQKLHLPPSRTHQP